MNAQQLTPFQKGAEQEIEVLLEQAGLAVEQREILSGTMPFYSKDPQTVIHIKAGSLQVWLSSDEANMLYGDKESRFEEPDFGSTDQLQEALLAEIRSRLAE